MNLNLNSLNTFDLLFFRGETFTSRVLEIACKSNWSHVGMVVKCYFDHNNDGKLLTISEKKKRSKKTYYSKVCILESSNNAHSKVKTEIDHKIRKGVQITCLRKRLPEINYGDKKRVIGFRKFKTNHSFFNVHYDLLINFINEYNGAKYETNFLSFIDVWLFNMCCYNFYLKYACQPENNLDSFFCSEAISEALIESNILNDDFNSGAYSVQSLAGKMLKDNLNDLLEYKKLNEIVL